jgi:hypothetical protein
MQSAQNPGQPDIVPGEPGERLELGAGPAPAGRRDSPRVAYAHLQWVAPSVDGTAPERGEFQEVCCRDISTSGFSYFAEAAPKHKHVIVALGAASLLKGVVAEIVHVSSIVHDGTKMYAIGCRYTGQVVR